MSLWMRRLDGLEGLLPLNYQFSRITIKLYVGHTCVILDGIFFFFGRRLGRRYGSRHHWWTWPFQTMST